MWVVVVLILLFSNTVEASLCVENNVTKCAQLGFTQNTCQYGGVACHYDPSLWYCAKWTCQDGRYYTQHDRPENSECIEVSYKGLTCYECYTQCPVGTIDYLTCWNGRLSSLLSNPEQCESLGYIHNKYDCTNYLACPSDTSKVHCIN